MIVESLLVTQRTLNRCEQIQNIITSIKNNHLIEPIRLSMDKNGIIRVEDGHHRLVAYYFSRKKVLESHEYELLLLDYYRPTFGNTLNLIERNYRNLKKLYIDI